MARVKVVMWKELRELAGSKSAIVMGALFALAFGSMYSLRLNSLPGISLESSIGSLLFFLTTVLGVFLGYTYTGQVFLREKMDAVIETLLCSPITLRDIWIGKTLAITALAHAFALVGGVLCALVVSFRSGSVGVPGGAVIVYAVAVLPALIACFVGALGCSQFLLGMKENRIVSLVVFAPLFAILYGVGYGTMGSFVVTWLQVALLAAGVVVVLMGLSYAVGRIRIERIVTTLS